MEVKNDSKFVLFDRRGVLRVLLVMFRGKRELWKLTEIFRACSVSQKAFYHAMDVLKEVSAVEEVALPVKVSNVRVFKLTEKGTELAKHVDAIVALMQQD